MALTSSGTISMSDMRTEFGISGAISMSDLYRGGSEVPSTKEITDGISSVSYSGVSGATLGYSERYMYGNLHTYSGSLGAGGNWAYGFIYNNSALSSVFNSIKINFTIESQTFNFNLLKNLPALYAYSRRVTPAPPVLPRLLAQSCPGLILI